MHELFAQLAADVRLTGDVCADMVVLLNRHGCPQVAEHCLRVGAEARRLAARFGEGEPLAQTAGWLHDVSAVFPVEQRVQAARRLGVEVLPEEEVAPMILHQKLSAVMARQMFAITDQAVLSAIECHSTLKADASSLDKVVFVADKIAWDQFGEPPFLEDLLAALEQSLDRGVLCYLGYLWQQRDAVPVVHPWFADAYERLSGAR